MEKIVIAGGTGFLGKSLIDHFSNSATELVVFTRGASRVSGRTKYIHWDAKTLGPWADALEDASVLINLNGKSVDCRYTPRNKHIIYSSRLDATAVLGRAIQQTNHPPKLWINASSATIYRHSLDKEMDELEGETGSGFSVDVCQQWEQTFNKFETKATRKIIIRTGIVLGKVNGALKPLKMLARLGLGGPQGQGSQYFSWIHEKDFVRAIEFFIHNSATQGVYNIVSPTPVTNAHAMRSLRSAVKIPFGIPLPKPLLEIGALLINTETELILKSRRVVPKRLEQNGFEFEYKTIESALQDLVTT
jgi:uncharacterized protein (TIGR01777 family)